MVIKEKICIDCGKLSKINHNAERCWECATKRRKYIDRLRYKKKRIKKGNYYIKY
jgi:hypothetical protein